MIRKVSLENLDGMEKVEWILEEGGLEIRKPRRFSILDILQGGKVVLDFGFFSSLTEIEVKGGNKMPIDEMTKNLIENKFVLGGEYIFRDDENNIYQVFIKSFSWKRLEGLNYYSYFLSMQVTQ